MITMFWCVQVAQSGTQVYTFFHLNACHHFKQKQTRHKTTNEKQSGLLAFLHSTACTRTTLFKFNSPCIIQCLRSFCFDCTISLSYLLQSEKKVNTSTQNCTFSILLSFRLTKKKRFRKRFVFKKAGEWIIICPRS